MANTTPPVTTVTKPTINPAVANSAPRVNIQEFCEEHYEDILPIIMEKVRHDRRKYVHTRLDFGEGPRERVMEDSYSNARARASEPGRGQPEYGSMNSPPESIDGYKDLKAAFLAYFMQQKKYVKDPVEIHNIKQRDGEPIKDFMERFKIETGRMKGAPECMRISEFMHGVNNPELTKFLNEHVPKTMEEMMIATISFIRGEAAAASKKKGHVSWKSQDQSKKHSDKRLDFRGHSREGRGSNRFTPLTRTPKEILVAKASKFQSPPPMVTPVEKRSSNKFCDFHNDKGHSTDECMQLKKQIKELVGAGKLSYLIKEIKQGREQPKTGRKEAATKDKPTTIYMVRSWQRTIEELVRAGKLSHLIKEIKQGRDQSKTGKKETAAKDKPTKIYMVQSWQRTVKQKAEMGGHVIHRMYIDDGSSMEILYEHCFNRLRPEIKSQMVPATTSLTRFSVPSTVHGMLKFPVEGGSATIRSTILIPTECTSVTTSSVTPEEKRTRPANFTVALHPDFPDQEVVIEGSLSDKGRTELCSVLKKNLNIFAWQPSNMTGVPRSVAEHRLNIREGYTPVRQKKKGQAPERARAIQAEVQKLVDARIMREVYYHDWLSNPVMVKKHDGSWRMCVDFTDQNRACPQDCYPLPEIDWKTLKKCIKKSDFRWTAEAEQAFQQLKQHLSDLPLLVAPNPQEELSMYLSATYGAVSAVLMTERGTTQTPIYFISRALQGPELNYSPMEKLVLSLVFAAKRLRRPRTSVKGQILADFLTEMPGDVPQTAPAAAAQEEPWTLFTDDSSCVDGSGAGLILTNPERVNVDSKLEDNMIKYLEIVRGLVNGFTTFSISQVPRSKNKQADALSKIASTSFAHLSKQVLVEVLENKSIKEKEVAAVIEEDGPTWMTQITDYLKEGILPGDNKEARKLHLKARQYELRKGVLYRRSFLTPWLRCVGPLQADYVMREIHEGSYSMHAGPRSVVAKAIRLGYYWPIMHKDARDMIRKCNDCQIYRPVTRHPQQPLTPITAPWPFYKYGIDIAGPFPKGPGKVKFLIVAMDYFTKWVEAKAMATIIDGQVKRVRGVAFKPGDFVYRSNDASHAVAVAGGKLGRKWEGPYEVTEALGNRAYKLRSTNGTILPRTWNVTNLKRYNQQRNPEEISWIESGAEYVAKSSSVTCIISDCIARVSFASKVTKSY
nr:reverse transcriptase domain-containing protein [Tanacetum cinerariifolium]